MPFIQVTRSITRSLMKPAETIATVYIMVSEAMMQRIIKELIMLFDIDVQSDEYKKSDEMVAGISEVPFNRPIRFPIPQQLISCGRIGDEFAINAIDVTLKYRKGGESYYDGNKYPSGYFINVCGVKVSNDGGFAIISTTAGAGFNCTIASVLRNTAKQRNLAGRTVLKELPGILAEYIAKFSIKF